jgi:hypothetical protein
MSDFLSGIGDAAKGMVPLAKGVMAGDGAASVTTSDDVRVALGKAAEGGSFGCVKDAAVGLLGSGAAFMIGYGAFAYAGYSSLSSMADAANKRDADLKTLESVGLLAAEAVVTLKQRSVHIADLQAQIAQADLDSTWFLQFQRDRLLNRDFWRALADVASRVLCRYLDLGAQAAGSRSARSRSSKTEACISSG